MKSLESLSILLISALLSNTASVQAQSADGSTDGDKGLYVSAFGGLAFPSFSNPEFNSTASSVSPSTKTGYGFGGAVGYSYGYGLSGEVEILWQTGDINQTGLTASGLSETGSIASLMAFANAVYKFENLGSGRIRPYIGAGLGYIEEIDSDLLLTTGQAAEFSSGSGFGWQIKSGIDFKINDSWSADLGFRFIDAGRTRMTGSEGTLDVSYSTWMTSLGITKRF